MPIDHQYVHRELRCKGVTRQILWLEYYEDAKTDPEGREPYQYSQFCDLHRAFSKKVDATMRQVHRAGEKTFVDYSWTKLGYFDRALDERVEAELFVAVLGASNYTYAEVTRTQKVADFRASTCRAFELVPDQLRSAVKGPDRLGWAETIGPIGSPECGAGPMITTGALDMASADFANPTIMPVRTQKIRLVPRPAPPAAYEAVAGTGLRFGPVAGDRDVHDRSHDPKARMEM